MQPTADWHWPTNWVQTAERPCEIHNRPDAAGERTEGGCGSQFVWFWHMLPEAWQLQLYGEVLDTVGFWTCPNEWNRFRVALIGTPGDDIAAHLATTAQTLWQEALDEKAARVATSPQAVDLSTARCDRCGGGMMLYMGKFLHDCVKEPSDVPHREVAAGSAMGSSPAGAERTADRGTPAPLRPVEVVTDEIPATPEPAVRWTMGIARGASAEPTDATVVLPAVDDEPEAFFK